MYLRLIGHDPEGVARMMSQAVREEPAGYHGPGEDARERRGKQ
jgi:hypothetical protein